MSRAVLIDGHSILNRAFYGIPLLSDSQGIYTNAVLGFLNIMFKILDEEPADYLAVAFDFHAPTFRHKMYEGYKATRKSMPEELRQQVPLMREVLEAMQIPTIEQEGLEADDILGTLSRQFETAGHDVSIISGDRDLMQLATEHIKVRIPKTKKSGTEIEDYLASDVFDKYQVTPAEFIDMKALMGDASDNIPGVPGIGEKTASKIISQWHSIEEAYAHASEIKPKKASENLILYYDQARMSKVLATIRTDCDLDFHMEDAVIGNMVNDESRKLLKSLELNSLLKRFENTASVSGENYDSVRIISELQDLYNWEDTVGTTDSLGICYFKEEGFEGASVCVNVGDTVFIYSQEAITPGLLRERLSALIHRVSETYFIDLKSQLNCLDISEDDRVADLAVAAYLCNPLKSSYTYDGIALDFLSETVPSRGEWIGKSGLARAMENDRDSLMHYLAFEALIPAKAGPVILSTLKETGMHNLFRDVEMPLVFTLHDMESAGIRVESEALSEYASRLTGRIAELENNIYELAGEKFNINSPKQLGVILFEKLKLPYGKKTKTGYSTSAEVLEKLRGYDPIIGQILEYRQLTKLKSTYADGLAAYINPKDQKIHTKFNQTITATGRISSTEPNLQNIPVRMELGRLIRKVFVPDQGCVFVDADYSQIELRVLAHMAKDENLIAAYKESKDIHRMTASQVFHTPFDEVTPLQRRNAKAVNFGIIYGISSFGLSQDLSITRKEAETYIEEYFKTYPGIKTFLDNCVSLAKERGYSLTMFGRRRPIPELTSDNYMQRSFGERVAMNSPIQGTAADIIKIAMVRVSRRLKAENMRSRLILQIHDELIIEAPFDEAEKVKRILEEEMSSAADLAVPLQVETHEGNSWYELK